MTAIGIRKKIRKALEAPLASALVTAGIVIPNTVQPAVQWPNKTFDRVELKVTEYVRFSMAYARPIVREMGKTPRIELSGHASVDVYLLAGAGQDRADTIAGIVAAPYPYDAELVFEGVSVNISTVEAGQSVPDQAWLYTPVQVNWTVWRT